MIKAEEIKQAVEFLLKEKQGCYFKKVFNAWGEYDWGIAIGWSGGFDEKEKTPFSNGEYRICAKICRTDNSLRCDYEWDFEQLYDRFTGEVYDTDTELGTDFEAEALRLSKEFERIANLFGFYNEE